VRGHVLERLDDKALHPHELAYLEAEDPRPGTPLCNERADGMFAAGIASGWSVQSLGTGLCAAVGGRGRRTGRRLACIAFGDHDEAVLIDDVSVGVNATNASV
jgi:hypothetical protein